MITISLVLISLVLKFLAFFFKTYFIYLRKKRTCGGAEGEGERNTSKLPVEHRTPRETRSQDSGIRPEQKPRVECLPDCATQVPQFLILIYSRLFLLKYIKYFLTPKQKLGNIYK